MGFKTRQWSSTNNKPYDVVYEDHQNNKVYYQPDVEFSTEVLADKHKLNLENNVHSGSHDFIIKYWKLDGAITE